MPIYIYNRYVIDGANLNISKNASNGPWNVHIDEMSSRSF